MSALGKGGLILNGINGLRPKEDCVREACKKMHTAFSDGLDVIYSDIWRTVKNKSPEFQASFVVNQEKEQVSELVHQQMNEMRNVFIEELCHASKAGDGNEKAYSHSQAVLMWQSVAIRIELPVLEYAKIEPACNNCENVLEEDFIADVLKRHSLEILRELRQSGIQEKKCEAVKKKLNDIIKKDNINPFLPGKIKKGRATHSMVQPYLSLDVLKSRKRAILGKLGCWIDSIGEIVLKEEPIL